MLLQLRNSNLSNLRCSDTSHRLSVKLLVKIQRYLDERERTRSKSRHSAKPCSSMYSSGLSKQSDLPRVAIIHLDRIYRAKNEAAEKIHRQVRIKITPVQLSRLSACLDRRLLLKAQGEIPRRRAFSRPCTPGAPSRSIVREERQSKHLPALELHVRRAHVHAHTGQTDTRFIRVRVHVRCEKTGATSRLSTVATLTP